VSKTKPVWLATGFPPASRYEPRQVSSVWTYTADARGAQGACPASWKNRRRPDRPIVPDRRNRCATITNLRCVAPERVC